MHKPHKPNAIIVIQVSSLSHMVANHYFDDHGIKRDKDYLLFEVFGPHVLEVIEPDTRQLVFTSHIDHVIDSREVARDIWAKNPSALTFALTSSEVPELLGRLSGVIDKKRSNSASITARLAKAFLSGEWNSAVLAFSRDKQ